MAEQFAPAAKDLPAAYAELNKLSEHSDNLDSNNETIRSISMGGIFKIIDDHKNDEKWQEFHQFFLLKKRTSLRDKVQKFHQVLP